MEWGIDEEERMEKVGWGLKERDVRK